MLMSDRVVSREAGTERVAQAVIAAVNPSRINADAPANHARFGAVATATGTST